MSLRLDWACLTPSFACSVRGVLNNRLAELVAANPNPTLKHIKGLEVTDLWWGDVPPFVEITEIGDYLNQWTSGEEDSVVRPDTPCSDQTVSQTDPETDPTTTTTTPGVSGFHKLFGEDGICVKVHCTYGGNLRLQIKCDLVYNIEFHPSCILGVTMPLVCDVTDVKFDGHVVINAYGAHTQVFIAKGSSPLTNVNITAQFGSTHDTMYVDEEKVCGFVVAQLRKVLTECIVEPNYVSF